jgi:integrase
MMKLGEIPATACFDLGTNTRPYAPSEIQALCAALDRRWPTLSAEETARWLRRWDQGHSPYSRIRRHAIRCQLEAIIGLALCCGLRRSEIYRQQIEWIHPDNAYVVVWDEGGPWNGTARSVPYTDAARDLIGSWCRLREVIAPENPNAWLNLWSSRTMHEPLTQRTFERLLRTYVGTGSTLRRLRDTHIVNQINAGVPLEQLSVNLGVARVAQLWPHARCVAVGVEAIR